MFYKKIVVFSWFNAGARVVDVRNPYDPKEVGFYIPATTENTDERCAEIDGIEECFIAIQTNNVEVDERGYIYLADRANTGLHIVELTGEARQMIDTPAQEPAAEEPTAESRRDGRRTISQAAHRVQEPRRPAGLFVSGSDLAAGTRRHRTGTRNLVAPLPWP